MKLIVFQFVFILLIFRLDSFTDDISRVLMWKRKEILKLSKTICALTFEIHWNPHTTNIYESEYFQYLVPRYRSRFKNTLLTRKYLLSPIPLRIFLCVFCFVSIYGFLKPKSVWNRFVSKWNPKKQQQRQRKMNMKCGWMFQCSYVHTMFRMIIVWIVIAYTYRVEVEKH